MTWEQTGFARRPNLTRPRGPDILPADVREAAQDGRLAELVPAEVRKALAARGNLKLVEPQQR